MYCIYMYIYSNSRDQIECKKKFLLQLMTSVCVNDIQNRFTYTSTELECPF